MSPGDKLKDALRGRLTRERRSRDDLAKARRDRRPRRVRRALRRAAIAAHRKVVVARKRLANYRKRLRASASDRLWGGSRRITNEVIGIVGDRAGITSRKRVQTFGNPGSDHHVSQLTADAVDFAIAEAHALADEIARKLGGPDNIADFEHFFIVRNGRTYRVQIIAGTHGTGPHLHVGVRRV